MIRLLANQMKSKATTTKKSSPYQKDIKRVTQINENEKQLSYDQFDSPIGLIEFYADDKSLQLITFFPKHTKDDKMNENLITNRFKKELKDYFNGDIKDFETPVNFQAGTDFQTIAWKALCDVKYGETASYTDVAKAIGRANAPRAVATACRLNKFPLIVPCHRIVSVSGEVVGFIGKGGIPKQHFLYDHEQKYHKKFITTTNKNETTTSKTTSKTKPQDEIDE